MFQYVRNMGQNKERHNFQGCIETEYLMLFGEKLQAEITEENEENDWTVEEQN